MVKLIEKYLAEDIEAVRRQYSYIPADEFDKIIRLDPTFDESRDSVGKYGKWLLGLYNKDNVIKQSLNEKDDEFIQTIVDHIIEVLSKYDSYKNDRTKDIERDIMRIDSIYSLNQAVTNVKEKELSKKQANRQAKKDKPYDMVFDGETYAIFVPKNHEGDMVLASFGNSKKANWCTAADSQNGIAMYKHYLGSGGRYYVLIDKSDYNDKYQFHFESEQFKNRYNEDIDLQEFIDYNSDVVEFFDGEGYNLDDYVKRVPEDQEEQRDIIGQHLSNLGDEKYYGFDSRAIFEAMDYSGFAEKLVEEQLDYFLGASASEQFSLLNNGMIDIGRPVRDEERGKTFRNFEDFKWNEERLAMRLLGVDNFDEWAETWAKTLYGDYDARTYFWDFYGNPDRHKRELVSFANRLDPYEMADYIVYELEDGYEWCEDIVHHCI